MIQDSCGWDVSFPEYETFEDALGSLLEDYGEESQKVRVFKALQDEERMSREVAVELDADTRSVSNSLTELKDEGYVYMGGSQGSDFLWGAAVEELYGKEDYMRL